MKSVSRSVALLFALVLIAGCASTKVTQETPMVQSQVQRPNEIWVYDFVATPADMPANASIANRVSTPSTPMTPQELQAARLYGALIAKELAADIQGMGLQAAVAGPSSVPQVGDGVIRGYIVSAEGGGTANAARRFIIGLGRGTSEMDTVVEGYEVTPQGWRKLGSGTLSSSGSKTPGVVAPAAVAIATGNPIGLIVVGGLKIYGETSGRNKLEGRAKATADAIAQQLRIRFQDRGWIS